jgi:hypothetical protein
MNNKEKSVGTTAEKSTTVETQHPSSHSNGNTHVVRSHLVKQTNNYILVLEILALVGWIGIVILLLVETIYFVQLL